MRRRKGQDQKRETELGCVCDMVKWKQCYTGAQWEWQRQVKEHFVVSIGEL